MKNKHALDPNGATFAATQPRGRGRPKTGADGGRVDPTSDLYMKQDGRFGDDGPICPTTNFDVICSEVFGADSKYKGIPANHPLHECIMKFSHQLTPGAPEAPGGGDGASAAEGDLHKEFRQKTTEII